VIPFQLEDMCDFGDTSVDDMIGRWIKVFGEEISQEHQDHRANSDGLSKAVVGIQQLWHQ